MSILYCWASHLCVLFIILSLLMSDPDIVSVLTLITATHSGVYVYTKEKKNSYVYMNRFKKC